MQFDPWEPAFLSDPYPTYRRLRDEAPCLRVTPHDLWAISRYDDVKAAMRAHRDLSAEEGDAFRRTHRASALPGSDPPEHTAVRRVAQRQFLPRQQAAWAARAYQIADKLLDSLAGSGTVDWKGQFAVPLVVRVTVELMGLPDDPVSLARYPIWGRDVMEAMHLRDEDPELAEVNRSLAEATMWFAGFLHERWISHRERETLDLTDVLLSLAGPEGPDDQLARLALTLMAAGNQNTADAICHAVELFDAHPGQRRDLAADPRLAAAAFAEVLRHATPSQAVFRTARHDLTFEGTLVPEGSRVMLLLASANRDEAQYDRADTFDISRRPRDHLAFGQGVHKCIGQPLAEAEGTAVLAVLAERRAEIVLTGEPERRTTPAVQGFDHLPVKVVAARASRT